MLLLLLLLLLLSIGIRRPVDLEGMFGVHQLRQCAEVSDKHVCM
jgi:hypothetical protein